VNQSSLYKSSYRSEIDGLRAFAVLSVVAFHAFPSWLKGGFVGVDVFFVISGFLITSHIFENLDKGQFSFTDFFGRRIRRIFPALILVMACSLAFGWFALLADEFAQLGKHVASGAAFITNFILVDESGYFDNAAETKPMLHLWSLAVEEQFYIVWPLVLWLAWKRKFYLLTITILVAVVSFYLNLRFVKSYPTETFFWPVGRFWELLSGSILAWLLLYKSDLFSRVKLWLDKFVVRIIHSKEVEADSSTISNLMSFFGLLLLAYGVIRINENLSFPSKWALIPVLGAVLIIASGSKAWLNRIFLMNPIAVWFGLISYPLYLWHWPILSFLQIIEGEVPDRDARILAVMLAVLLAWLTYKLVESPIRYGYLKRKLNAIVIVVILFSVGGVGYYVSIADWSETKGYEDVVIPRNFEHGFGTSLNWYKGKDGWLFLGNAADQTVAKRRLAFEPSIQNISEEIARFEALAKQGMESNTKVVLLVGPNKSSVYTEYLPNEMNPSDRRYSTFITDRLREISNLLVVDPTDSLIAAKSNEGILYWRTDSHWNQKGSYLAFKSLMEKLSLNIPSVDFIQSGSTRRGDLIKLSKLSDFPLSDGDDWRFKILSESKISKEEFKDQPKNHFGWKGKVSNTKALNDMSVWVIGDSFISAIRPYIDASFRDVRYVDHWSPKLDLLPSELALSAEKPDLILVVRVERTF
tara:strand:- start:557 stop:2644 length:2088 start_codon:yes stop_codon:yes gene_type:complete